MSFTEYNYRKTYKNFKIFLITINFLTILIIYRAIKCCFFFSLQEAKPSASSDDAGPSTSPAAEDDRPDCTYWEKCYRKDPNHLKQFRHPADGPPQKKKRPKAENKIEDGEEKSITGGYRLKRIGSHYTCT